MGEERPPGHHSFSSGAGLPAEGGAPRGASAALQGEGSVGGGQGVRKAAVWGWMAGRGHLRMRRQVEQAHMQRRGHAGQPGQGRHARQCGAGRGASSRHQKHGARAIRHMKRRAMATKQALTVSAHGVVLPRCGSSAPLQCSIRSAGSPAGEAGAAAAAALPLAAEAGAAGLQRQGAAAGGERVRRAAGPTLRPDAAAAACCWGPVFVNDCRQGQLWARSGCSSRMGVLQEHTPCACTTPEALAVSGVLRRSTMPLEPAEGIWLGWRPPMQQGAKDS